MSDDQRVYSDEEFAIVLRQAAELASKQEPHSPSSGGLTLSDMQSVAAQVGIDPALVERAARMLAENSNASPFDRFIGGPIQHSQSLRFPIKLDEAAADRLLSAVRISANLAGRRDVGHSGTMGMTWHDGGDTEALSISARPDKEGTLVTIALNRKGTVGVVAMVSGISIFFTVLFSVFALYPESHALGLAGFVAGIGGIAALARGYWASSTRKVRERMNNVIDTIGQTIAQSDTRTADSRAIVGGTEETKFESTVDKQS